MMILIVVPPDGMAVEHPGLLFADTVTVLLLLELY